MKILKIILCILACVVWITAGVYILANPEKGENRKSVFIMLSVRADRSWNGDHPLALEQEGQLDGRTAGVGPST